MSDFSNLVGDKLIHDLVYLAEDPDANREQAKIAVKRAMAEEDMSLDLATRLYGYVEPHD